MTASSFVRVVTCHVVTSQLNHRINMPTARKLSGLQKDVLSLYRALLREATKKDRAAATSTSFVATSPLLLTNLLSDATTTTSHARNEFRRQAGDVARSDFRTIEYLIRKGRKHVKLLQMPGVRSTSSFGGGTSSGRSQS